MEIRTTEPYKISFCTTCMNRLFHLKETLPVNILNNLSYPNVEFVVLNYNSKDEIDEWMEKEMINEIRSHKVKYIKTLDPLYFKMSHAKNMVTKYASGDIVCNLDADNFTGSDFANYINNRFNINKDIFLTGGGDGYWDTLGRVCLWKSDFLRLRGYDERILDWGYEDIDLYYRLNNVLKRFELKIEEVSYLQTIKHGELEKMANGIYSSEIEFGLILETSDAVKAFVLKKNNKFEHLTINPESMKSFIHGPMIKQEDIRYGEWYDKGERLEFIDSETNTVQTIFTGDGGQSYTATGGIYRKMPKSTICHYYSLFKGRLVFQDNVNLKKELNYHGFGEGVVFEPLA